MRWRVVKGTVGATIGLLLVGCTHIGNVPIYIERDPYPTQSPVTSVEAPEVESVEESVEPEPESSASVPPPARPAMKCQKVDLKKVKLSEEQESATFVYGSKIVDSVQVDAGQGYRVIAVRLMQPFAPEELDDTDGGSFTAAWVRSNADGWVVPVSSEWEGGGTPDGTQIYWGSKARDVAVDCLEKLAVLKPPAMKCRQLTKNETKLVNELNTIYYGGKLTKSVKVSGRYFSVVATHFNGAIDGVEGASDHRPKDVTVTWSFRDRGDHVTPVRIETNWGTAENSWPGNEEEKRYGAQMRKKALSCLG